VGGTDPGFWPYHPGSRYDSWLSVGLVNGDPQSKLGTVGQDWSRWTASAGVSNSNCAVFWMDPRSSTATKARGAVVVAQLTVLAAYAGTARAGVTGRDTSGAVWRQDSVAFPLRYAKPPSPSPSPSPPPASSPPPPPPPPPVPSPPPPPPPPPPPTTPPPPPPVYCGSHTCSAAGTQKVATAATTLCAAQSCTDAECCIAAPAPAPPPPAGPAAAAQYTHVVPQVTQLSATQPGQPAGHTTWRLSLTLQADASNAYSVMGTSAGALVLPPAWHSARNNAAVGGADPQLFQFVADSRYDSWLTVGLVDGDPQSKLGTVGQDWSRWTASAGVSNSNCAVFWLTPSSSTATKASGAVVSLKGL
jgi:hypothetical protein